MSDSLNLLQGEEMLRVSDLKLAVHSYSIQYLIYGKILALIVFFLGLSHLKFLAFPLMSVFELSGYWGSSRINSRLNNFFIWFLGLSILVKVSSCFYLYSLTVFSGCLSKSFYSSEDSCDLHSRFIIGSVLLIAFEVLQMYSTWKLMKVLEGFSELKREDIKIALNTKSVSRFICWGELNS
jgi:hypothetical protein